MQHKIQGLVLSKIPFQERHLLAKILLRNGQKASVLFFGGMGGGLKKKTSLLDLGTMQNLELRPKAQSHGDLWAASEWSLHWGHQKIRYNYKAYTLLCLFIEMIDKLSFGWAGPDEVNESDSVAAGLFRVLSNGIFFLEDSLKRNDFLQDEHLLVFSAKLLAEMGHFPLRDFCIICSSSIASDEVSLLMAEKGGMACLSCLGQVIEVHAGRVSFLRDFLNCVWTKNYKESLLFLKSEDISPRQIKGARQELFNYLMYQFHWNSFSLNSFKQI